MRQAREEVKRGGRREMSRYRAPRESMCVKEASIKRGVGRKSNGASSPGAKLSTQVMQQGGTASFVHMFLPACNEAVVVRDELSMAVVVCDELSMARHRMTSW